MSLGLLAVVPTLGLYLRERFGLEGEELQSWTGIAYAAAPFTAAVVGPVWGVLGDRKGRKLMVLRASFAIGVTTALMPLATTPEWFTALRILQGAFAGYIAPAMALGTADVPPERQGHTLGRLQLALAMGMLTGPAVGAEIAHLWGRSAVFYFTSALSIVSMLPVALFVREDRSGLYVDAVGAPARSFSARFVGDLTDLLRNKVFVALLLCIFALRLGQNMVEPYIALWVPELGALPAIRAFVPTGERALELTIAASFVVLAVAQLLFTTSWGRLADRVGPLRCLGVVGLALGGTWLWTAHATGITTFFGLRCVGAVFMAGGMTLSYASVARRVRPERKTLAFSLVQSGMQLGMALGPVVGDLIVAGREVVLFGSGIPGLYRLGGTLLIIAGIGMLLLRAIGARLGATTYPG